MRGWRTLAISARRGAMAGVGMDMRFSPGWTSAWLAHTKEAGNSDNLPKGFPGGRSLLPARARRLHDNVVHDLAHAWRDFRRNACRLLLLGRMDQAPEIDAALMNRDGQHRGTPGLRTEALDHPPAQLRIIGGRKGRKLFRRARQRLEDIGTGDD